MSGRSHASQDGAIVTGASASATTTLGRKRRQSPPATTSRSAPSTSILRMSIVSGAYCSHSSPKVMTGIVIACERLPNSLCAAAGVAFNRGRQTVKVLDEIVGRFARLGPDERLDADIARPHRLA